VRDFQIKNKFLFIPTALVMILDYTFTLVGQPASYWQQDFSAPNESSPFGFWLLSLHPLAFFGAGLLYTLAVYAIFTKIKPPFNFIINFGFLLGHFYGSAIWIPRLNREFLNLPPESSWWLMVLYSIIVATLVGVAINRAIKSSVIDRNQSLQP